MPGEESQRTIPTPEEPEAISTPEEPEEDRVDDAERPKRRGRLLVIVGLLCFIVGVPLVSLPDGTALSVIGLSLETVAGACVISFIYMLAGDRHEPDGEEDEDG